MSIRPRYPWPGRTPGSGKADKGRRRATQTCFSDTCQSTFTFGSGQTLLNFCTLRTALDQFTSSEGFKHILVAAASEGYGICDINLHNGYFDYADGGLCGKWNDPVMTQPDGPNTCPLKTMVLPDEPTRRAEVIVNRGHELTVDGEPVFTNAFLQSAIHCYIVYRYTHAESR